MLDLSGVLLTQKTVVLLCEHLSMRRLRVLLFSALRVDITAGIVKAICSLPEQHTLRIANRKGQPRGGKPFRTLRP